MTYDTTNFNTSYLLRKKYSEEQPIFFQKKYRKKHLRSFKELKKTNLNSKEWVLNNLKSGWKHVPLSKRLLRDLDVLTVLVDSRKLLSEEYSYLDKERHRDLLIKAVKKDPEKIPCLPAKFRNDFNFLIQAITPKTKREHLFSSKKAVQTNLLLIEKQIKEGVSLSRIQIEKLMKVDESYQRSLRRIQIEKLMKVDESYQRNANMQIPISLGTRQKLFLEAFKKELMSIDDLKNSKGLHRQDVDKPFLEKLIEINPDSYAFVHPNLYFNQKFLDKAINLRPGFVLRREYSYNDRYERSHSKIDYIYGGLNYFFGIGPEGLCNRHSWRTFVLSFIGSHPINDPFFPNLNDFQSDSLKNYLNYLNQFFDYKKIDFSCVFGNSKFKTKLLNSYEALLPKNNIFELVNLRTQILQDYQCNLRYDFKNLFFFNKKKILRKLEKYRNFLQKRKCRDFLVEEYSNFIKNIPTHLIQDIDIFTSILKNAKINKALNLKIYKRYIKNKKFTKKIKILIFSLIIKRRTFCLPKNASDNLKRYFLKRAFQLNKDYGIVFMPKYFPKYKKIEFSDLIDFAKEVKIADREDYLNFISPYSSSFYRLESIFSIEKKLANKGIKFSKSTWARYVQKNWGNNYHHDIEAFIRKKNLASDIRLAIHIWVNQSHLKNIIPCKVFRNKKFQAFIEHQYPESKPQFESLVRLNGCDI